MALRMRATIYICMYTAATMCFSSFTLASEHRSHGLPSLHSLRSRTLLQTTYDASISSNTDPSDAELAYCYPYYYVYGYTGHAYAQCLNIVEGAVFGSGYTPDECYAKLYPLATWFTSAQWSSAVQKFNLCLFDYGYTISDTAQARISSATVPVTNTRVGPGPTASDNYVSALSSTATPTATDSSTPITVNLIQNNNNFVTSNWGRKLMNSLHS